MKKKGPIYINGKRRLYEVGGGLVASEVVNDRVFSLEAEGGGIKLFAATHQLKK